MGKFFWEVRRKAIWGSVSGIFISVLCFCVHRRAVMLWALFFSMSLVMTRAGGGPWAYESCVLIPFGARAGSS